MSYILEGLKKLEKTRQRPGAPGLFTTYGHTPSGGNKKKWWPYAVALAVVVMAVAAAGLYLFYPDSTPYKTAEPSARQAADIPPPAQPPPQTASSPKIVPLDEKMPLDPPLLERSEDAAPAGQAKASKKSSRRKAAVTEEENPTEAPVDESVQKPRSGERIVPFKQLPEDVKKSLPEMKVFLHFYSPDPKERYVQINEHILHEGKSRPDGLKVLKITEDAAIFSYQEHRFKMKAVDQ